VNDKHKDACFEKMITGHEFELLLLIELDLFD